MPSGGKRPGAGKPKGSKHKRTLQKEIALKFYQDAILKEIKPLIEAQFNVATGVTIMIARNKIWNATKKGYERKGAFAIVSQPEEVLEILNNKDTENEDWFNITTKDPDTKMLDILMNRVFGRPKEQIDFGFDKEALKAIQTSNQGILEIAKKLAILKYKLDVKN